MPADPVPARSLRPAAFEALDAALEQAQVACPDGLLELCRARVRAFVGGASSAPDAKLRAVTDDAAAAAVSDLERLAVEFTEQYVMEVSSMPDALVAELHARLGTEGLYAFVMGLYAVDQAERLAHSAAVHPGIA